MRILDRYILREIALHFVAVTGVLAVIMVSFRVAGMLNLAASNQLSPSVVWSLIGLFSLTDLTVLMPIGLFLAIMLGLGRLYHDSEMAAMQSCGFGVRQLYGPVLTLAIFTMGLLVWLAFIVVPDVYGRASRMKTEAIRDARLANLAPQHFGPFAGGEGVYYAERVDENGMLYNVFVQRRIGEKVQVTVADRAEQRGAGSTQQTFVLYHGEQYEGVPGSGRFRVSRFAELGYPIQLPAAENWSANVKGRPSLELLRAKNPLERAEFERRLADPILGLILALLAVPLARLRPRQGRYSNIGLALLAYFLYQVALQSASSWMEKEVVPSVLGFWWVHLPAACFAMWFVLRQDPLRTGVSLSTTTLTTRSTTPSAQGAPKP